MGLTKLVIRRPVSAVILIGAILIFGLMSILTMPQELTPEMELPMLVVVTTYPGAAPEDVDKLISREIEGSVGSLSGVRTVMSNSSENVSIVILRYEYGSNMDIAYTDLKERLDLLDNTLPDSSSKPIVMEMDMNAMAVVYLSVSSEGSENLLNLVEEEIVPEFEKLASVADVTVSGGREDYIKVELMAERMQQHGVTMSSIANSVSGADFSMPIGTADYGSQSLPLRTEVKYNTLDALRNIPITVSGGGIIRLSDVANVYITTRDASSLSRYNGNENIGLSIQKRQSSSAVTVSRDVMKALEQLRAEYPSLNFDVVADTSETITSSIRSVGSTLILGVILSMVVLFIFLGDFKASLIVGSSMPVSLLITFVFMNLMGFSLNIVSLSAMVLGVGMMVDNSIVVIDSCFKSHTKDRSFSEAALEGTKFVMLSIVASTITTVVVFLPLALIEGISGQLFRPLGFTIVFSLMASLISAITLVPLFFVQFKPRERKNALAGRAMAKVENSYAKLLHWLLGKKKTVFAVAILLLAISLVLATQINVELMPGIDQGTISIAVETRPGLKLERMNEIATQLEDLVASHPDVEHYTVSVGGSSLGGSSAATITAYLDDDRKMDTQEIVEQWRYDTNYIMDCNIDVSAQSMMSTFMSSDTVEIRLKSHDLDNLRTAAKQVDAAVKEHPDILRTASSVQDAVPQAEIVVDPMKAASLGLSPGIVASNVYNAMDGTETVTLRMNDKNYAIWVEYPAGTYQTVGDLENMLLMTQVGNVALTEVASVEFGNGPQTITREDNQYVATVTVTPKADTLYDVTTDIDTMMADMALPRGVTRVSNTMQESIDEEFTSLGIAILVAVLLVFMVMAIQFESVKYSLMVMICIPFCLIGSFGLLYLAGSTISMVSLLGFLILVGTVVNNGILFVDTANQYRQTMEVRTALAETGRTRLRPILMTTLTTVLSMLPLALGLGSGGEMMQGMGVTVIGGLAASTILTLLLLPTFYFVIDGNVEKRAKRKAKREERKDKRHEKLEEKLAKQEEKVTQKREEKQEKKQTKETPRQED